MLCPHFRSGSIGLGSKEAGPQGQTEHIPSAVTQWCTHMATPVDRQQAMRFGGSRLLHCQGNLAQCQVPADQR